MLFPLALLSAAALSLEVLLTRFLAYSASALLVSVVLGIALLGFGAGGSLATVRPVSNPEELARRQARASLAFSWATLVSLAIFCGVSERAEGMGVVTVVLSVLLSAPFVAAGLVVARALSSGDVGKAYAANLGGSALGCAVPFALLSPLSGERLVPVCAALGALAALLFSRRVPDGARLRRHGLVTLGVCATAFGFAKIVYSPPAEAAPYGQLGVVRKYVAARGGQEHLLYDRWNPVGRIQIFNYDLPGEPSPYPFLFYAQDSSASSTLAYWDRKEGGAPYDVVAHGCREAPWGQAYFVPRKRVLVIGLGGGMDVQCALVHGAEDIDVVEINPDSIDALRGAFDDWVGGIGRDPRVHFHVEDGRSFVHRSPTHAYDLVQLSGVDTKNAEAASAHALVENTLYTTEAFGEYLNVLADDGALSIVRFGDPEAVRLVRTIAGVLRARHVRTPAERLIVWDSTYVRGIVVRNSAFPAEELARAEAFFAPRDPHRPYGVKLAFYEPLGVDFTVPPVLEYAPSHPPRGPAGQYLVAEGTDAEAAFVARFPHRTDPVTDDSPFFFDLDRHGFGDVLELTDFRTYFAAFGFVLVLSLALAWAPARFVRLRASGAHPAATLFFVCIGLAFLLVEVWWIHRLGVYLGHQTYAFGVVLVTLLVGTGLGASWGERLFSSDKRSATLAPGVVAAGLGAAQLALGPLLAITTSAPFAVRVAIAGGLVASLGFFMGQPFPAGLRWARAHAPAATPWYVAVNGFSSVVATLAVTMLARAGGYVLVLALAAALYLLAGAMAAALPERR